MIRTPTNVNVIDEERALPALYMLHDTHAPDLPAPVARGYCIEALNGRELDDARVVIELDGGLSTQAWERLLRQVLPGGLIVARDLNSGSLIGTASALHNPEGSRYYFPAGGELGYLVVHSIHRGQGLGSALVRAVTLRFRSAGYHNLWLGVQGWRIPAIRAYLHAGYRPFLHPPNADQLAARWQRILDTAEIDIDASHWLRV